MRFGRIPRSHPYTTMTTKWIYLTDVAPQATIMNVDNGELRNVMSSAIVNKAPGGFRRGLLEEQAGGMYRETGDTVPLTESLLADIEDSYKAPNNWNYDWPHLQIEQEGEDVVFRQRIQDRLTAMMEGHPFEFEITALQRRYLMYFSDGNATSQQKFVSLLPQPNTPPFRLDGTLRKRYDFAYDSLMRDASAPYPKDKEYRYGGLRPCLYMGPAWAVRFRLDGQDPLLDRCRVYVDDEAGFICSDWCQRHDYSSYGDGINLQTGLYTFDGWVVNSCVSNAMSRNAFTPRGATIKREAVRDLMKKSFALEVPTFSETFTKAQSAVTKFSKATTSAPATLGNVDAGPLTADVMLEAQAAFEQVLLTAAAAKAERAATALPSTAPERSSVFFSPYVLGEGNGWTKMRMPQGTYGDTTTDEDMFIAFREEDGIISAHDMTYSDPDAPLPSPDFVPMNRFSVADPNDNHAFNYVMYAGHIEPLEDSWWLHAFARFWQEQSESNEVMNMLLETT